MNKSKNNDIVEILGEFDSFEKNFITQKSLLFKDDRLSLIIIYALIESTLDFLLTRTCKHGKYFSDPRTPFISKATILNELKVIDDQMLVYIKIVNKLRNTFAHKLVLDDKWKEKLSLDEQDPSYKHFLEMIPAAKLDGLTIRLTFVWWRLGNIGKGHFLIKHFGKAASGNKKKEK